MTMNDSASVKCLRNGWVAKLAFTTCDLPMPGHASAPSPGTPGEGWGEGLFATDTLSKGTPARRNPHPEYRARGQCSIRVHIGGAVLVFLFAATLIGCRDTPPRDRDENSSILPATTLQSANLADPMRPAADSEPIHLRAARNEWAS